MIFALLLVDRQIVNPGDAPPHVPPFVEFPVFIAVGAKPSTGIVMPFIGEPDGDAVPVEEPEFFDQAIVQLLLPFFGRPARNFASNGGNGGVGASISLRSSSVLSLDCMMLDPVRQRYTTRLIDALHGFADPRQGRPEYTANLHKGAYRRFLVRENRGYPHPGSR